ARVAVQPREVGERERVRLFVRRIRAASSLRVDSRPDEGEPSGERENRESGFHFLNALSSAMLRRSTLTRGSPKKPNCRPCTRASTSARTRAESTPRARATRATWRKAFAGEISGSRPEADDVAMSAGT